MNQSEVEEEEGSFDQLALFFDYSNTLPNEMAQDYSRSIINSLFSPQPGTNQPRQSLSLSVSSSSLNSPSSLFTAQESYIAYVQTFEPVPNSDQRKPRFLIVSCSSPHFSPSFHADTFQLTLLHSRGQLCGMDS